MSSENKAVVKSSTPTLETFDPTRVPFQFDVLLWLRDPEQVYSEGVKTCLLSGSVGSAKSILAAHLIVTHALMNPGAGILVLRRTLKDLKRTVWAVMLKHYPELKSYWNKSEMTITLPNGSIIYGDSYDGGDYEKFRSYELSMAVLEEATECKDKELFDQVMERIGRLSHVKENIFLLVTNPDSPSHWIYTDIIEKQDELTKVFYSRTEDNPFLARWYIENLKKTLDPKRALRMLYGQWIEITQDIIYYAYDTKLNRFSDQKPSKAFPIDLMFDFNIGLGKPMSMAIGQRRDGKFLVFDEVVIAGASTPDVLDELASRGYFDEYDYFRIFGDASGANSDTRNNKSDYEIIKKFLQNYDRGPNRERIRFEMCVPLSNPIVRTRHNIVNAQLCNANDERSLFVSTDCPVLDKGLRLTSLKKGGNYVEDDSKEYQHVTTSLGYWVCRILKMENINPPTARRRA